MSAKLSRGLRNLNPGNIRRSAVKYKGECKHSKDPEFKQFRTLEEGYRAIFVLLHTYSIKGYKSVREMINRYAPPSENNTEAYINRLCRLAYINSEQIVDTTDHNLMVAIVAAISLVENGSAADRTAVESGWRLFAADFLDKESLSTH